MLLLIIISIHVFPYRPTVYLSYIYTIVRLSLFVKCQKLPQTRERAEGVICPEKNDKRVNEIIIALNNLIEQPFKTKTIGFREGFKRIYCLFLLKAFMLTHASEESDTTIWYENGI